MNLKTIRMPADYHNSSSTNRLERGRISFSKWNSCNLTVAIAVILCVCVWPYYVDHKTELEKLDWRHQISDRGEPLRNGSLRMQRVAALIRFPNSVACWQFRPSMHCSSISNSAILKLMRCVSVNWIRSHGCGRSTARAVNDIHTISDSQSTVHN